MASEQNFILLDGAVKDDLILNQDKQHHGECSFLEGGHESEDRQLGHPTISRLLSAYYFILHLVCLLLAVSLFVATTVSKTHPDLAMLGTGSTTAIANAACPDIPADVYTDYDNRYPDWIPVSYELQREDALDKVKNEFSGMPNDANTKAWDDLITRWCSSPTDTVILKANSNTDQRLSFPLLYRTFKRSANRSMILCHWLMVDILWDSVSTTISIV